MVDRSRTQKRDPTDLVASVSGDGAHGKKPHSRSGAEDQPDWPGSSGALCRRARGACGACEATSRARERVNANDAYGETLEHPANVTLMGHVQLTARVFPRLSMSRAVSRARRAVSAEVGVLLDSVGPCRLSNEHAAGTPGYREDVRDATQSHEE